MKRYRNLEGHSGVVAYDILPEAIAVKFAGGDVYDYTYRATGRARVETMKALAEAGRGLSTFIARYVRDEYERKHEGGGRSKH
ncbi:hypothetical protein [Pseudoduganella umbonata]|uniref:KTSC domain-containing protein n=1 Tax=Pseudoduganella umbonata TaxID=864828 RepID=A0A4V1ED07_9BURK|nr:hypothetical protein [Pseudoduganella umbonata]MBB3219318.1 hypothetical protein [Pseudoduganella umbonata]QCP09421.1 hypothetical protein FCL38_02525 [Pseudoduganella umbonata]